MCASKSKIIVCLTFYTITYIVVWGGIAFGFYCWYMDQYTELKGDELPEIVAFGTDVKKETYIYNPSAYFCRPYYIVDYKYNGKTYHNIKTYDFNIAFDYSYEYWNDTSEQECIKTFVNHEPSFRQFGTHLHNRFVLKKSICCIMPVR
jgi:hypothetical protein